MLSLFKYKIYFERTNTPMKSHISKDFVMKIKALSPQILFWAIVVIASAISATRVRGNIAFGVMNGSWQNFNVVRRFLDGQAPFSDFAVYLGYGHLLVLSLPQILFGNNFAASLVVTLTVVFVCFAVFWYAISKLVLKDFYISACVCLAFLFLNLLRPDFFIRIMDAYVMQGFNAGISPGNSALIIRLVIIPIAMLIFPPLLLKRMAHIKQFNIKSEVIIPAIAGPLIVWSNDGGISWFLSFSLLYGLLHLVHKGFTRDLAKSAALYVGASLASLFVFLTLITYGNPMSYFTRTLGISSYQRWYFVGIVTSLLDFNITFYIAVVISLIIFFVFKFIKGAREDNESLSYFWLSNVLLAFFIQTTMYFFSNATTINNGPMYLSIFIIAISFAVKYIVKQRFVGYKLPLIMAISFLVSIHSLHFTPRERGESYISQLGGSIVAPSALNLVTAMQRIGDRGIFSTYAGPLEAMTNQFQPTGIDYIIHALGDRYREHYLNTFLQSEHHYAITVHPSYNIYTSWGVIANWFFCRHLFRNYIPVFSTDVHVFWERALVEPLYRWNFTTSVEQVSDGRTDIVVTSTEPIDAILDMRVYYSVNIIRPLRNLDIQSAASWTDSMARAINTAGMPPSSTMRVAYKPITVSAAHGGYGRAIITAAPYENVILNIYAIELVEALPLPNVP